MIPLWKLVALFVSLTAATAGVPATDILLARAGDVVRRDADQSVNSNDLIQQLQKDLFGQCNQIEFGLIASNYNGGRPLDDACNEGPEHMCEPQCLEPMVNAMRECESEVGIGLVMAACGSNDDGELCFSVFLSSVADIVSGITHCLQATPDSCSSECREDLLTIRGDFGCCYGNYYNSSSAYALKYMMNSATETLSSFHLWHTCGVDTVGTCLREFELTNFTRNATDALDTEFEEAFVMKMLGQCSPIEFQSIASDYGVSDVFGDSGECNVTECEPPCFEVLLKTMEKCESEDGIEAMKAMCATNEEGRFCDDVISGSLIPVIVHAIELCSTDGPTECSNDCKEALVEIEDEAGCCYSNILKATSLLLSDYMPSAANTLKPGFWDSCEVDLPENCQEGSGDSDSKSKSKKHKFYYGPLIILLVLVGCAVAVVVFIRRRRLSVPKVWVIPKVHWPQGYHKLMQQETLTDGESEPQQTEL